MTSLNLISDSARWSSATLSGWYLRAACGHVSYVSPRRCLWVAVTNFAVGLLDLFAGGPLIDREQLWYSALGQLRARGLRARGLTVEINLLLHCESGVIHVGQALAMRSYNRWLGKGDMHSRANVGGKRFWGGVRSLDGGGWWGQPLVAATDWKRWWRGASTGRDCLNCYLFEPGKLRRSTSARKTDSVSAE